MARYTIGPKRDTTVGVRELRQYLSVYLDRVKQGEALTVTEHGAAVAILRPLPARSDILERLVAEGRATRPTRSIRDLPKPITWTLDTPLSEILDELREDVVWWMRTPSRRTALFRQHWPRPSARAS